ncbi:MAG: thiol-activated cytolysin family protein, partial [Maribacter sp.]|nr:thiol-activated cytolysin family protein [Maribacter sp.]
VDDDNGSINNELAKLQAFSQPAEIPEPELLGEEAAERDGEFECVVKRYKAAPGFDQMLSLDPTSDVIYPGAMLKGESIPTGEYIGINGGRAPITLSVSLQNINGTASVDIEDPQLDNVRNGVNSLLAQGVSGATPAKLNFTIEQVYSEEHLDIALGANYRSRNKDISGSFDFENSQYYHKYVVKFFQEYYTIDMNLPTNDDPGSLFTELPNLDGTSPVYVSSVKYGRMVLYTVESNYQTTDVKTAFKLSFNQGVAETDAEAELDYEKIISESKVEALVLGGSAEDAVAAIDGPSGVYSYIKNGGNYSSDSPGAPLAYTLRHVKEDFPIARVVLASEYVARNCDLAYPKYRIRILQITTGRSNKKEIYGKIYAGIVDESVEDNEKIENVDFVDGLVTSTSISESNFKVVSDVQPYSVSKTLNINNLYRPDIDNLRIFLYADLKDDNGFFPSDNLGTDRAEIFLSDLESPVTPQPGDTKIDPYTHSLDGFEDKMEVTFYLEKIQ